MPAQTATSLLTEITTKASSSTKQGLKQQRLLCFEKPSPLEQEQQVKWLKQQQHSNNNHKANLNNNHNSSFDFGPNNNHNHNHNAGLNNNHNANSNNNTIFTTNDLITKPNNDLNDNHIPSFDQTPWYSCNYLDGNKQCYALDNNPIGNPQHHIFCHDQ
jgi:hypothetical protein